MFFVVSACVATICGCAYDFDAPFESTAGTTVDGSTAGGAGAGIDASTGTGGAAGTGGTTGSDAGGTAGSSGSGGAAGSSPACDAGTKPCDGQCVTTDDPLYGCATTGCTPCGGPSADSHATYACSTGSCVLVQCSDGYDNCDNDETNGCETNTQTDTDHCGACYRPCSDNHVASSTCVGGACQIACADDYANCNGDVADGCETSLTTGVNCGSCGNTCPSRPNASAGCSGTTCYYQCIGQGSLDRYENCNGDWSDGCEIYMTGNPDHCGTCYNACDDPGLPHVHRSCDPVIPTCTGVCDSGYYNCNGTWSDGCESSTSC